MAAPVVESQSTASINNMPGTVPKPSGVVSGDLLVAVLSCDGIHDVTISGGAGWTQRVSVDNTGQCRIFTSTAGASEPADYDIDNTGSTNDNTLIVIFRVSGADTTTPIDVSGTSTGTSATPVCPDITTTQADTLLFACHSLDGNRLATADTGQPSGYTLGKHVAVTVGSGACVGGASYKTQASAGASGTATYTCDTSDTWCSVHVAIAPAGGGPTGGSTAGSLSLLGVGI